MSVDRLREALVALRAELYASTHEQAPAREPVEALANAIEEHIEQPRTAEEHAGLLDRVRAAVADFENEHPRLVNVLDQVALTLSEAGI